MATETQTAAAHNSGAQTQAARQSRVGKRAVPVPKGVTVDIKDGAMHVQGPKGKLSQTIPAQVEVAQVEGGSLKVSSSAPGADAPRLQGLVRALLVSMIKGVSEGYERALELVGTGYRCEVKGQTVTLQVGLSHTSVYQLPPQVSGNVPGDSRGSVLILSSPDKAALGQVAASIRAVRPPEPYGGKGIRYRGEQIRRKAGKAGKGRK